MTSTRDKDHATRNDSVASTIVKSSASTSNGCVDAVDAVGIPVAWTTPCPYEVGLTISVGRHRERLVHLVQKACITDSLGLSVGLSACHRQERPGTRSEVWVRGR